MTDIAASDVTYTVIEEHILDNSNLSVVVSLAFGDGSLTYPSGGIPLVKGKIGLPRHIKSLNLVDPANANGFIYKFDLTNEKLRIYEGDYSQGSDGPLVELASGSATPAAATVVAEVEGY